MHREHWRQIKTDLENEQRKTLFKSISEKIEQNAQQYLEASKILSNMACRALKKAHETKQDLNIDFKDWPALLQKMASAQRSVVPSFGEDLAERILEDLQNETPQEED